MSDFNWSVFLGKFYSSGRMYYDWNSRQFKDVNDLNLSHIPAYLCANSFLGENYTCKPINNQLPMEFEMALTKIPSTERNFLLQKFELGRSALQKLVPALELDKIVRALVIVSRKGTVANYASDKKLFVYTISDEAPDQFYFAARVNAREQDDNKLYIHFVFEGDFFEQ